MTAVTGGDLQFPIFVESDTLEGGLSLASLIREYGYPTVEELLYGESRTRPAENPFVELQLQRLAAGGRSQARGLIAAWGDLLLRRRVTREWSAAWRATFGVGDTAGFGTGLDAWRQKRKQMSAREFIARYLPGLGAALRQRGANMPSAPNPRMDASPHGRSPR